jgi:hypothetical protein
LPPGPADGATACSLRRSILVPDISAGQTPESPSPDHLIHWPSSSGGWQPAATHSRLTMTASTWLSCSATTVARPQAVCPMMRVPSSFHRKCLDQRWRRGLNSLTRRPVSGSRAYVCVPLKPLHSRHASHRLSSSSVPPRTFGIIWSISSDPRTYRCELWQ